MTGALVNQRGSLMIEAAISLIVVTMALVLSLELARRAYYEVMVRHGVFLYARSRALGWSDLRSRNDVIDLFNSAGLSDLASSLTFTSKGLREGLKASVGVRFDMWMAHRGQHLGREMNRHHFEFVRTCIYPWR